MGRGDVVQVGYCYGLFTGGLGLHYRTEMVGEQLPDGERVELVVNTLVKEALPLIRYRIGDLTVIRSEPCRCGRIHSRIISWAGPMI